MITNTRVLTFFEILDWLKENDPNAYTNLDHKLKQIAGSEKSKVEDFFETVIDQAAFSSVDHNRFKRMVMDWYAAHRTLITQAKDSTDPYSLSSETLNELIKSFGFPYPELIASTAKKSFFLTDLINLYQKKGTPEILVKVLQTYFGLTDVVLSEWWIHKTAAGNFIAKAHPIYPEYYKHNTEYQLELPYSSFIAEDPLWHLDKPGNQTLAQLYQDSLITLPSLTTHITLQAALQIRSLNYTISILTRKLEEAYKHWINTGDLFRDISLNKFDGQFSFIELYLAIIYLFNSSNTNVGNKYVKYYTDEGDFAPLDNPLMGYGHTHGEGFDVGHTHGGVYLPDHTHGKGSVPQIEGLEVDGDGIDEVDYNMIIDEYNNLTRRPISKNERETLLNIRNQKFTIATDSTAISFIDVINNVPAYFETISPDFKASIDQLINAGVSRSDLLQDLMLEFEGYVNFHMEIFDFNISFLSIGSPLAVKLEPVINFFKPFHVRLRDFLFSFSIDDPLADSELLDDRLMLTLLEWWRDRYSVLHDSLAKILIHSFYKEYYKNTISDWCLTIPHHMHHDYLPEILDAFYPRFLITEVEKGAFTLDDALVTDISTHLVKLKPFYEYLFGLLDSTMKDELSYNLYEARSDRLTLNDSVMTATTPHYFYESRTYESENQGMANDSSNMVLLQLDRDYLFSQLDASIDDTVSIFVVDSTASYYIESEYIND